MDVGLNAKGDRMFFLLDLYICLSNKIEIEKYKEILEDFKKLWGIHIHLFIENIKDFNNYDEYIDIFNKMIDIDYSIANGFLTNSFKKDDIQIIKNKYNKNCRALEIVVKKEYLKDLDYINFIDQVIENKIPLELYFKMDKKNCNYLDDIVEFCNTKEIKICIVDIDKKSDNRIGKDEYRRYLNKIEEINSKRRVRISVAECPYLNVKEDNNFIDCLGGCAGGISSCVIDEDGNVLFCYYLREVIAGNIKADRLINIWNNSEIFKKARNRKNIKGKCSKCKYILCCGGCRAESYFRTGDLFNEDFNCWL